MAIRPNPGVYSLRPSLNINQVADVLGQSKSDEANLLIYGPNAGDPVGNHQKFALTINSSQQCYMRMLHSSKMVDVAGGSPVHDGQNVWQFTENGSHAQEWVFDETRDIDKPDTGRSYVKDTINGEELYAWAVCSALSYPTTHCMDAAQGQSTSGTNIQVFQKNNTKAQRWFLVKDCKYKQMSVPSSLGIATSSGGEVKQTVYTSASSFTFYPSFVCSNNYYQLRYRIRPINTNGTAGSWSYWKSPSGSNLDNGYGDVWTYNQDLSSQYQSQRKYGDAITESFNWSETTGYPRYEMQLSVRAFDTSDNSSGSAAVSTITINKEPTLTVGTPQMTYNGLSIPISGTPTSSSTNWSLTNVTVGTNTVCDDIEYTGYSGNYTIPFSDMFTIPSDGDTLKFTVTFSNYFATKTQKVSKTVSYTQSISGLTMSVSNVAASLKNLVKITVSTTAPSELKYLLKYKHKGEHKTINIATTSALTQYVDVPLYDADLYVIAKRGSEWGILHEPSIVPANNLIAWKTDSELVKCSEFEKIDIFDDDYKKDSDSYHPYGANYYEHFVTKGGEHNMSVSGLVVHKDDLDKYLRLQDAGKVLFRTPEFYGYCEIIGVKKTRFTKDYYSVSVEQYEVN